MTIILDKKSTNYKILKELATTKRIVLFAGLPGVGKSLWLSQLAVLANEAGRELSVLQWDVSRLAFETPDIIAKYPEINGATHAMLRKAVGVWARDGVLNWHKANPNSNAMLIGEVPLVGNRFIELVQKVDDEAEGVLGDKSAVFALPVPTRNIRAHIEKARDESIANPRNEKEVKDAPTNVLQALWRDVYNFAHTLGISDQDQPPGGLNLAFDQNGYLPEVLPAYSPVIYGNAYLDLLKHRHAKTLVVDALLKPKGSVYDLAVNMTEVKASVAEAERIVAELEEQFSQEEVESAVNDWYKL